jgi:hypothetical protein
MRNKPPKPLVFSKTKPKRIFYYEVGNEVTRWALALGYDFKEICGFTRVKL